MVTVCSGFVFHTGTVWSVWGADFNENSRQIASLTGATVISYVHDSRSRQQALKSFHRSSKCSSKSYIWLIPSRTKLMAFRPCFLQRIGWSRSLSSPTNKLHITHNAKTENNNSIRWGWVRWESSRLKPRLLKKPKTVSILQRVL